MTDRSTARLHCPAGNCLHGESYDPTHQTQDPTDPASADLAYDQMIEHLTEAHDVPRDQVGHLASHARRTTTARHGGTR